MSNSVDPVGNRSRSQQQVGYVPRSEATESLYQELGFRCGLEVHQQLRTAKKLFCRCPAGQYQHGEFYDAQLVRHMRPTLSELGEYDGTALMEFKTRKNIIYRIKGETACTYDIDDTPPFPLNRKALDIAMEIALLLGTRIVGELHITRKQYLDGSIPTGFQRTAIVGIHGEIPLSNKKVRILQLSIEEDSCREVSDQGHERVYTTDRLGMPLVETVTYPDLLTPEEAEEAGQYIRHLTRSTGKVNVGIGAGREDVNVSIEGGTRVEIKGVQHIRWIPELTHNEAFRQKALLLIRDDLQQRIADPEDWEISSQRLEQAMLANLPSADADDAAVAVNLPDFSGVLSFFTNPGRSFLDELSDRVKVVACIEKPNLVSSESTPSTLPPEVWANLRKQLGAKPEDAQLIVWGPEDDLETAVETLAERCQLAMTGVPNETRRALPDGTTLFERVLPGPDRMYPDTDSAPIPIDEQHIEALRSKLPIAVATQLAQLDAWQIPQDVRSFLLSRNLYPVLEQLVDSYGITPLRAATLLGHRLRAISADRAVDGQRVLHLVKAIADQGLDFDILDALLAPAYAQPEATLQDLLATIGYQPITKADLLKQISGAAASFKPRSKRTSHDARYHWVMGQVRHAAAGDFSQLTLSTLVKEGLA